MKSRWHHLPWELGRRVRRLDAAVKPRRHSRVHLGAWAVAECRLAAALWICACGSGDARFDVKYAADLSHAPVSVSVLGAYENGRMNEAAGSSFAHHVSRFFGPEGCNAGFDEQLRKVNAEGFSALEAQAEAGGANDELLRMIAPAAHGDFILVLEMFGSLTMSSENPRTPYRDSSPMALARSPWAASPSPGVVAVPTRRRVAPEPAPDLEVSASMFSVRLQRTVTSVTMRYTGSSLDHALQRLAENLATMFPNASCRPWNWEHVRVLHEQDTLGLPLRRFRLIPTD